MLTGVDASGDRLWGRQIDHRWVLSERPNALHLCTTTGKQRHATLELDPRTGTLTAESGLMQQVEESLDE